MKLEQEEKINELASVFTDFLGVIDPNSLRGGLLETPQRAAKAWIETWASGYNKNAADILKTFEDGAEGYNSSVCVEVIEIYSHCEHHLAPIIGHAVVAYIPNNKIVGLSKMNRLVDMFARRLQVQERLTTQIADAIDEHLEPHGVAVFIRARHLCMESRGVRQSSVTSTMALRGEFADQNSAYPDEKRQFHEACARLNA